MIGGSPSLAHDGTRYMIACARLGTARAEWLRTLKAIRDLYEVDE